MKFEDYHFSKAIEKNLAKMGFKKPTDIQYKSIPSIMKGEDVLAIAQTGTGKTAAFVIPILDRLIKIKKRHTKTFDLSENQAGESNQQSQPAGIYEATEQGPRTFGSKPKKVAAKKVRYIRAVVMEPTRELAIQVGDVFKSIGRGSKQRTAVIVGGVDQAPQIESLLDGVDILVATPGRVFDLISQGFLDVSKIEILVLDEADHMLDLGFIKDIQDLLRFLPKTRQTLFFSATINDRIKKLAYSLVRNPIRIQLSPKDPVAKNIDHALAFVEMDEKRFFLERIIRENPTFKILVFVRTQVRAERVVKALSRVEIESEALHGGKDQEERLGTLQKFKGQKLLVLVATDVTARGIDIADVDMVINYDMPDIPENYVHRVGRTGRGKNKGKALSFCAEHENELLQNIEQQTGTRIERLDVTKSTKEETIEVSGENKMDLEALMKEVEEFEKSRRKKKRK